MASYISGSLGDRKCHQLPSGSSGLAERAVVITCVLSLSVGKISTVSGDNCGNFCPYPLKSYVVSIH